MYIKSIKLFFLLICILILSSCNQAVNTDQGKFTVVTSFYPVYISTVNITRDIPDVEVINMTKPQTGCLHDYKLSPNDLITLEKANAFVINGAGMEAFMDKVISSQKNLKIVEASRGIELIKNENNEVNPHVWVSVSDAIIQVKNISEGLAKIDTKNAAKYKAGAENYIKKLEALKDKMHASLKDIKNKNIITFHEAFPYFAKEFGLNIATVIEREPGTAPTSGELSETIKTVNQLNIKAMFAEPQYPAVAANTIAAETGAKVYTLDPLVTGVANKNDFDAYINKMNDNLKTLLEALK